MGRVVPAAWRAAPTAGPALQHRDQAGMDVTVSPCLARGCHQAGGSTGRTGVQSVPLRAWPCFSSGCSSLSPLDNESNNRPRAQPVPEEAGWLLAVSDGQTCQRHGGSAVPASLGPGALGRVSQCPLITLFTGTQNAVVTASLLSQLPPQEFYQLSRVLTLWEEESKQTFLLK